MPCYHPLEGWYSKTKNESGKRSIVFNQREAYHTGARVTVPCGQCIGCRLERSRQWAMRCLHEASLYDNNSFITLTYDDDHLPGDFGLVKEDFSLFMKRLRKAYSGKKIRFYQCGEYGEVCGTCGKSRVYCICGEFRPTLGRPHYHACLFNLDFEDKVFWSERDGCRLYVSEKLNKIWGKGYTIVGDVTFESAAYVARYINKKILGGTEAAEQKKEEHYGERTPEFSTMSRRPGIGAPWLELYKTDVFPDDFVVVRGKKVRPPRFYDTLLQRDDSAGFESIKTCRQKKTKFIFNSVKRLGGAPRTVVDGTTDRLEVKEKVKKKTIKALKRGLEEQI